MRRIRAIEALIATLAITGCSTVLNIAASDGGTPVDGGVTLPDGGTLPEGGEGGAVDSAVPPPILADNLENALALAVDDNYVWFTRSLPMGAILTVPKNGGPVATLGAKLGAGGWGSVYAAVQSDLGRHVAIKVLHTNVALSSDGHGGASHAARRAATKAGGSPHVSFTPRTRDNP